MSDALKLAGNDQNFAPDMYFSAHDQLGAFVQMDTLAPITDMIEESALNDLIPMTKDAGTYQGKKYQLPLYFETHLFLYNKDLINEVPETTDDLLKLMEDKSSDEKYVFVEQHSTAYNSVPWIRAFGAEIINADAEPGLNSP